MFINGTAPTSPIGSIGAIGADATGQPRPGAAATRTADGATSTELSASGQLISKVSQLKRIDPDQFKGVVSSVAAQLHDASTRASGLGATMLAVLASKLDDVANGGDIDKLATPEGGGARAAAGGEPAPGPDPEGATSAASAANAYRSSATVPETDSGRAALAKVLDQLDAALKATTSSVG